MARTWTVAVVFAFALGCGEGGGSVGAAKRVTLVDADVQVTFDVKKL